MHPVRDLREGQGRIIQKQQDLMDGIILYPMQGALAGDLLADGRQVLRRHAEFARIPRHLALLPAIPLNQREEPHEEAGRFFIGIRLFHH